MIARVAPDMLLTPVNNIVTTRWFLRSGIFLLLLRCDPLKHAAHQALALFRVDPFVTEGARQAVAQGTMPHTLARNVTLNSVYRRPVSGVRRRRSVAGARNSRSGCPSASVVVSNNPMPCNRSR